MPQSNSKAPNLLLLSNSRNPAGEYLVHARDAIAEFAGRRRKALFFPFAGVTVPWDDALGMLQTALAPLDISISGAHHCADLPLAIREAELLVVGGGNTFRLLYEVRRRGCIDPLRTAVAAGAHYIGWSAGSVLATPSICTTNDMPIIDPQGLDALGLIPYQLNCHYNNALPPGHQGETRNQRIAEYLALNADARVLALPEGNWLEVRGDAYGLHGASENLVFTAVGEPRIARSGPLALR